VSAAAPRISVVLPVYNGEAWLGAAVQSVLEQTLEDFELIIGDDASSDRSVDILRGFSDSRLRVHRYEQNVGLFRMLNRLISKATGPVVHFFCQDDVMEPACLLEEASFFETHPDVVFSICQATMIDATDDVVGHWPLSSEAPIIYDTSTTLQLLLFHGCIAGNLSTVCVRRRCFEDAGGFNEQYRLAGDYEMWVRLSQRGPLADLQKRLVRERLHRRRLSFSQPARVGFVRECRTIRDRLVALQADEARSYAARYTYWRQNVLDTHSLMRCLMEGRFAESRELARVMGARDLAAGITAWLITANNHLYRPKPRFHREPRASVQVSSPSTIERTE
jgi:glycosyltransferase involved in cell wall biosynthesis